MNAKMHCGASEGCTAIRGIPCVSKLFCSTHFCIVLGTRYELLNCAVLRRWRLYWSYCLRPSLIHFTMTGCWLQPSSMQITTCLYVAQTAVPFFFRFLFHGVHYWCIPSSNISWCSQMLFCECSWRIQAREFQLGLLPPGTGEGGLRAGVV